jgi:uncharacterized protein (TIGR02453 family)
VNGPLLALIAEVSDEFGSAHVFRPNRDVRFSADKSPYKTQASAVIHDSTSGAVYYVEISMDGLLAASGYYMMSRDQLARFRGAVDDDGPGEQLATLLDDLRRAGYDIHGEALKTAPRGYSRDHPRAALLRHKGVTLMADLPPGRDLSSRRALDHVVQTWRAADPLNRWLATHVGPAEESD